MLKECLPTLSRNGLFTALRKGRVRVNGERVREAGHLLAGGEEVRVEEAPVGREDALRSTGPELHGSLEGGAPAEAGSVPAPLGRAPARAGGGRRHRALLVILHEDDALLVLDKPADLAVHPGSQSGFTLIDALREYGQELGFEPHLVHRLDRGTTGVIVAAKSKEAAALLGRAFKERGEEVEGAGRAARDRRGRAAPAPEVKKWYIALVWGDAPASLRLTEPLDGLRAITEARRAGRFRWNELPVSLLNVDIRTGRKHQIRRHLAAAGYPVVGDDLYGDFAANRRFRREQRARELLLHAAGIEFTHPISGERLRVEANLPKKFKMIIQGLYSSPPSG